MVVIDSVHIVLTINGSIMNFGDMKHLLVCYIEIPMLANFMFILVILGYIYVLRLIATIIHFWFGPNIYVWLKRRIHCLSLNELHLIEKFPIYDFKLYSKAINNHRVSALFDQPDIDE